MKSLIYFILILIEISVHTKAQSQLDTYIQFGIDNNQVVQQHQFEFDKSVWALQEARSLFLPRVNFETDYFLSGGGRTVDFPVGDLLNPVFATLNQLTESNNFNSLANERILLNPNNFYDAKFRTTLPILKAEIALNKKIKADLVSVQDLELQIYKRELVKEIKAAYYGYLQALESVRIFEAALLLAKESSRINQSLFNNDRVNRTVVIRAENEVIRFQNQLESAYQQVNNAKAYFNFLLNRDLDAFIIETETELLPDYSDSEAEDFYRREEIKQLTIVTQIDQHRIGLAKSYLIPKISSFLDLGSQGFDWKYNSQTRYYFFGISTRWNIFSAGQNRILVKQAELDQQINKSKLDQVSEQLRMTLQISQNNYRAAYNHYQGATKQYESAKRAYDDATKLYASGQILFIELLDFQNQLITALLKQNISLFDCHIKSAEIERANASFNLNLF